MTAVALALHIGAVVWVGGMFAIYVCLRPALGTEALRSAYHQQNLAFFAPTRLGFGFFSGQHQKIK
jgi:uncharacterized membrane protein